MGSETTTIQYQRRGGSGTLRLAGVMDIFDAGALRDAAQKALADEKAKTLRVDFADVERLDLSAAQILMALRRETLEAKRAFQWENAPEQVTQILAWLGMTSEKQ